MGEAVKSSTLTRVCRRDGEVILHQISRTEGLLCSERMCIKTTHVLEAGEQDAVSWKTWCEVVWSKPLPWTQLFIAKFIENRVKADTGANAPKLMAELERWCSAERLAHP